MRRAKILIVEDDTVLCMIFSKLLERCGHEVTETISRGEDVMESIERNRPDLILMDIWLKGDMDGIAVTKEINDRWDTPVVYITAHTDAPTIERANETRHYGYIQKPVNYMELQTTVDTVLAMRE